MNSTVRCEPMSDETVAVGLPPSCFAPHAVAERARLQPDGIAIEYVGGPIVTNAELDGAARSLARRLASLGAGRGTRVGTFVPNGRLAHESFIGLGLLTATEVPLNPGLTGALLRHALFEAEIEVILVAAELVDRLHDVEHPSTLRAIVQLDGDATDAGVTAIGDLDEVDVDLAGPRYRDLAAIMFTSGTTGPSKGVRVPWATVHQFWSWVPDDAVGPEDVVFAPMSMAHNSGRSCFNYTMARGARFVSRERFSGTDYWNDVRAHGCTVGALVGPMTQFLFSLAPSPDDADTPLRSVICGPLIGETEAFKARFGVRMATSYGMTETGIVLSTGWDHGPPASCGKPRPDYPWPEVRLVDEHDEPVRPGTVGELVVRTAEPWSMNVGYHGRPETTAEAWRNGWFHTGDAFKVDDKGWYHLVDRMQDTIRRRGENISSFELESIAGAHSNVTGAAAIGVPATHGEHDVMLVVEVADPVGFDRAAFRTWLMPQVPRYMVPRYVDAVSALPRNQTTQRVRKQELRERGVTDTTLDGETP
jgi:carnitine-CoA ligase